ncbi:DUF1876 domain-containing protein [Streptomyces rapamycinicus]|uniref:DUF1876 domain-containing protein n=2 Tax=Streptomyces rapamycinicus TaxID=1226757 RepID=A0A0A0N6W8_STRRN|nr:DUF1876 domain-containing protein [Streptomyces rapamycinicus]AGP52811.1 hypothetical protein M271_05925 [Streptomyces rapamycinicus NRRL 5491]MBB4780285.1 hypothetical protein [Streptomyces rapamycinicus]RLV75060.1 hypothetical protein D3C57_137580 [Streptomyces rapamycinicus NRRL 5491]UTO61019.1 DUF1876 domain-containing protein [Streptomyces rapamycinicus]UTP28963.1 DUF1876 domain-containing protein [Streptomyces rapamycinicus NRRL 5491]
MSHTVEWKVHLYLSEDEGRTRARVELDTGSTALTGRGLARCNPDDEDVPVIGDELAAGRALSDLAQQLAQAAEHDLESAGAPPASRRPRPGYGWIA